MTLSHALGAIAAANRYFFNSFYRRVRVIREAPSRVGTAVTVDITHRCSLRCPFCIAAGVLGQDEMPLGTFEEVASSLKGIDRLTLVGGEPFVHRDFKKIAALSLDAASEVEVFTNGLVLGSRPSSAAKQVTEHFPQATRERVTLVLSVDPSHASQMRPGALARAVDCLLAAEQQGVCMARFSVTHSALSSGAYMDTATVRDAIGEVSPRLADLFMDRLMNGRVQESFYFNSVICARTADSTPDGSELLRLEDLVFSPEVAITFNSEGKGEIRSALTSVWSRNPPPATCLGPLSDPASIRRTLELGVDPGLGSLMTTTPYHRIMAWDGGKTLAKNLAARVRRFLACGVGDRTLRWGGEEGTRRIDMTIFREIAEAFSDSKSLRACLTSWVAGLFCDGMGGPAIPLYAGQREILGMRTPLPPGEVHELQRVHLPQEPGFGPDDELVVRPVLFFHPGGAIDITFPGIVSAPVTHNRFKRAAPPAFRRIIEIVATACGPAVAESLLPISDSSPLSSIGPLSLDIGHSLDRHPILPDPHDFLAAFEECSYDRNRQGPAMDNPELIAMLMAFGPRRFPVRQWKEFCSRGITWLEQCAKQMPLSSLVTLLADSLPLTGPDARRQKRLLTAERQRTRG